MGIVSDAEFDSERNNVTRGQREESSSATIIPLPTAGRKEGDVNVPDSLRRIIGDTSVTDGPAEAKALATAFGISASSASAYSVGATSTATYDKRPNAPVIDGAKLRIQKRASKKLHVALAALTPEKISEAKAVEIASIARHMSAIVKDMEPEQAPNSNDRGNGPTFVFMAPPTMKEEVFDVKYVRE